jgi:hypothetical protein
MALCNPKSRIQERAGTTRPKLGEFKQVFRARVAQRGKDLRHQRAMEARMSKTAVGDDDCAMEEECDDIDIRSWLQQQWALFADEEGIGALTIEEAEELLEMQEELYRAEKAQYGMSSIFVITSVLIVCR